MPYNLCCFSNGPLSTGQRCQVGCVPLACVQIMSYYQWPTSFKGIPIDWDAILNYPEANYGFQCPYSLSMLFKYVGDELNAAWNTDVTKVSNASLISNFSSFGYQAIGKNKQLTHSAGSNALKNGPILVCGDDANAEKGDPGHMWVMDGYLSYKEKWPGVIYNPGREETDAVYYHLFHCIWGWYGYNNGYFAVPNGQSTGTVTENYDEIDLGKNNPAYKDYKYINLTYWSDFKPNK
ncbi:MAG: C10 family peptidase [Prevotella sp.]|nr:C10 family peptidase [Prevotella sp.]MCM1075424.1 C10 family peptidase [Ruminococcus sp.]